MPDSNFHDGDYSAPTQHGPTITWVDPVLRCTYHRKTFHQDEENFSAKPMSEPGPGGSYMVEEEEPKHIGGGIIEWDRLFMTVPPTRTEIEGYVYARQWVESVVSSDPDTPPQQAVVELPVPTVATVVYDYFHTDDPTSIEILFAFKLVQAGQSIFSVGDVGNSTEDLLLAEDTEVSRVRGNIWQRTKKYVPNQAATPSE